MVRSTNAFLKADLSAEICAKAQSYNKKSFFQHGLLHHHAENCAQNRFCTYFDNSKSLPFERLRVKTFLLDASMKAFVLSRYDGPVGEFASLRKERNVRAQTSNVFVDLKKTSDSDELL